MIIMPKKVIPLMDRKHALSITLPGWIIWRLDEEGTATGTPTSQLIAQILGRWYKDRPVMVPMRGPGMSDAELAAIEALDSAEPQASDPASFLPPKSEES